MENFEFAFVMLFAVATGVALIARWIKIPYTVALVVAGLALGSAEAFAPPKLTKELLFAVFLPGLLFEAAFHLDFRKFVQNKLAIVSLAMPGLLVAIGLTAALLTPVADAMHFIDGFNYADGFLFAALIAATDPIAVVGLFKSLGVPKRLGILVEGESLLNDGTAVVVFTLILGVVGGASASVGGALIDFVRVVGMGLIIGAAVGFAVSQVIHRVDDPMIEITLTTLAAYGSFLGAEYFHFSGVIATVTAGMLCGNFAARTGMSASTRVAVESFWEYLAFALNSIIFLLIGFRVNVETLAAAWLPIVVAFCAVLLARAVVVYGISGILRRTREKMPWSWSAVITWGGLRGGLSMVLVLSLPENFAHRDFLITLTFGVVVLSILVQGLSMSPLLRKLGIIGGSEDRATYERRRGAVLATNAALQHLEQLSRDATVHEGVIETLRSEYRDRADETRKAVQDLHLQQTELRDEELHAARRHLLLAEKHALIQAQREGFIGAEAFEHLMQDADARLALLEFADEATPKGSKPLPPDPPPPSSDPSAPAAPEGPAGAAPKPAGTSEAQAPPTAAPSHEAEPEEKDSEVR